MVPNMTGRNVKLNDKGDQVILLSNSGIVADALVYGNWNTNQTGWSGPAVQHYYVPNKSTKGEILYRKLDQASGLPVPDTNTAADWAQDPNDPINGRKVLYPGWHLDEFFQTAKFTEPADLTILVAPDNIFEAVKEQIEAAQESIDIEVYALEHAALAELLAQKAKSGVKVRVLLDGEPAFGMTDQEKWCTQQIEQAGGEVYFMINDSKAGIHKRYQYQHAKFIIIDGKTLIMGSQNLGYTGMPDDDKSDGTRGQRGIDLITDAPQVVAYAKHLFSIDLDPNWEDIFRWKAADSKYGAPPSGFSPDRTSGGTAYQILKPAPLALHGNFNFEIIQSPENSLRNIDSLLGLIAKAGAGDTVLVEEMEEQAWWGSNNGSSGHSPNPRLEAYINAARRGAKVRILLDGYFDPCELRVVPKGNEATRDYANGIAQQEKLDLEVKLGNPTGAGICDRYEYGSAHNMEGIHNKMVLVQLSNGSSYIHIGSLNGSEASSKVNRELAIQIQSNEAYRYLADIFDYDWQAPLP